MDEKEHYVELIRIFDKMIAEGNWEGGLFFQVAGNKLKDFRDQLKKKINIDTGNSEPTPAEMANYIKQRSGLIEVYIALYSAEGNNLRKWEVVLSNLTRQLVNRPIYKREKDIQDIIKTKENPINDAYAIAYVSETDIIKFSAHDKPVLDRFGHELVSLKEGALKVENITKFVHLAGEYSYNKGNLTKL